MASDSPLKALLIAEGSGGHLIPALQVAEGLAHAGVHVKVWYAQRRQTATGRVAQKAHHAQRMLAEARA